MKNDDYILFDRERGHYYDPNQGGQVYYSHIHEEVLSTTDQLQIRRSIHSFSMRYFIRMQFRITPNQFIGTEFRILNYHTSLIGNMEGIAMRKSFDFGFSWGVALNRKK